MISRVSVYHRALRLDHECICTQQLVSCTLCDPAHTLTPRQLVVHVRALWDDSQQREYAQQQVVKLLVQQSSSSAPVDVVADSSPSAGAAPSSNVQAAAASVPPGDLRSFRDGLKVGNLVDFESHKRAGWFVGEVTGIDKSWAGLRQDDVSVHIIDFDDSETVQRDSSRLWPPCTKSTSGPVVAAAAAAASPSSSSAAAVDVAPVRSDGQVPANRAPPPVVNFGRQLRRGDACDCLDTMQKWIFSEVIGSDSTHLLIHYGQCGRSATGAFPRCVRGCLFVHFWLASVV